MEFLKPTMVDRDNANSIFETENNLPLNVRQKCHRWWLLVDFFKNIYFFYDCIKTGLFVNLNETKNYDGINDFCKRPIKKKRHSLVPITAIRKTYIKYVASDFPRLIYLERRNCYFTISKHCQNIHIPYLIIKLILISEIRSTKERSESEYLLRRTFDINNSCVKIKCMSDNVLRWLLRRKHALLTNNRCSKLLRNSRGSFQTLIIEANPTNMIFLYFCVQILSIVHFDICKTTTMEISSCRYSIPVSLLNSISKDELRDENVKCLVYNDAVYKFAVRKMEGTGERVTIPILQQHPLTIPVYSAKTKSNAFFNEQTTYVTKLPVSSADSNGDRQRLDLKETIKIGPILSSLYAVTNGNDDYYYQDAFKRYISGGTETLKKVNAEMSKTLKDGVGTLNNINLHVREYLNKMERYKKILKSKVSVHSQFENEEDNDLDEERDYRSNEKKVPQDDEAAVCNQNDRMPAKSSFNEDKEVREIIEIDKILKTEMENKPMSLENLYQVMRHVDNINEYQNVVINHNDEKRTSDCDDHYQNRINELMRKKKLETDENIISKFEKRNGEQEEIINETLKFAKRVNSQPRNVIKIKNVEYDSDGGSTETLKNQTCPSAKEKKKRKIKIITKKSMLSNTTIIEVQSPKTCNKTREEKLEELIKALSKKSGDERIRQIMEFLQEQTVSSQPFQSDLVEDIPRTRALTNIHGRLKQEELARDSLFEFQKKMCPGKKAKTQIRLPTSLTFTRTFQENKKKLIHLRAQELFVSDRHINRLRQQSTPLSHKNEKDETKLSFPLETDVRSKGQVAKYLEKRRNRLIQNALDYKLSHHNSATVHKIKTATITMPKDATAIKRTLEKKASSNSDNNQTKSTFQLSNHEKNNDFSNGNDKNVNEPLNDSNDKPGKSAVVAQVNQDSKPDKTNHKFYDLKENPDYSRNPVEDYSRDKHKWLRHNTESPKSSKNSLYCFDILDEITPNDVQPLKSEYPRRDNILPEKIPHPCDSFLGKLINRGNRKVLETLLKVETPKIVCSTPNCITCRIKDNSKRPKVHNKNSASSERSFSSDEATSIKKKNKGHLLIAPKRAKKYSVRSNVTTIKNAKSAGFEGAKKPRLRKICSDRSRSPSQCGKRNVPKNIKLNVPKGLRHSKEFNYSPSTSCKKNIDSFTRQEVKEKLKQYMVDPHLHHPTTVTIMPVSVVYHTFDNTTDNPRMMSHSTARVPIVHRQQREERTNSSHSRDQERFPLTPEQNPSYIFTSTTQEGETHRHKNQYTNGKRVCKNKSQFGTHLDQKQQKNSDSAVLTNFSSEQNKNDVQARRSKKETVTKEFVIDGSRYRNEEVNRKSTSLTDVEQLIKMNNKKSKKLNQENAEAAIILPKIVCKRTGVKSAPSKHKLKGNVQKEFNRPSTENTEKKCTLQKPPLKKLRDKNRNIHFKDDIQKVIQSVEFKMVDILSDPRKHNVDAFIDVEKEITNVLAKFKTNEKTIEEEEEVTTTSALDADDKIKASDSLIRSHLMLGESGSNSTTVEAASSSLSIISKKDEQILTDICTMVKKRSPRVKNNAGTREKNQASKIISRKQTTFVRLESPPSHLETVEESNEHIKNSLDRAIEEKSLKQTKHRILSTSLTTDEDKKESIPSFYSHEIKSRLKERLTNSVSTFPSSSSFLRQHSISPSKARRRKMHTKTSLRPFSTPSRAFTQHSSRSRPYSFVTTKANNKTHHYNKTAQSSQLQTTNDDITTLLKCNGKTEKNIDMKLQPKVTEEQSPKYEVEKLMTGNYSSTVNVCEREVVKKDGGSGDIATVLRDYSEIMFAEDKAKTIPLDGNNTETLLEEKDKRATIDVSKSWTDTDLTKYTDSFHVGSNSAEFNVTPHMTVNADDTDCQTTEEKCFITAAYEPQPQLSEKIDATLAKIEAATRTIEKAMQNADDNIETIISQDNTLTDLGKQSKTANREDDNSTNDKETNYHDNILYFLDNLTTLTAESNTPLPTVIIAIRKFCGLSALMHISLIYYKPTTFYCVDTYHEIHPSKYLINEQEMSHVLDETHTYARDKYIYDRDLEKQLLLHSQNRFGHNEFDIDDVKYNKEDEKIEKRFAYKAHILDLFYGLLFILLYLSLIFNYACHFME